MLKRAEIVVFGDSITEMGYGEGAWVAGLQDAYSRKADVLNRGYSGFTTRTVQPLVPEVARPGLKLATLWLGANDSAANAAQHVPLAEFERRLTAIAKALRASCDAVVVITPPPVVSSMWPDRSNPVAMVYGAAAARAAAAAGASLFDAYAHVMAASGDAWPAALSDGLHLSRSGGEVICAGLLAHIAEHHPSAHPDALPLDAPLWRDMNPADPGSSLAAHVAAGGGE